VVLTVFFALLNEVRTRRAQLAVANGAPVGAVRSGYKAPGFFAGNPAAVVLALFIIGAVTTIGISQFYNPEPAKAVLLKEKRAAQQLRIEALQRRLAEERKQRQMKGPDIFGNKEQPGSTTESPGASPFGNVFNPNNLEDAAGTKKEEKPAAKKPGAGAFGNVFDPNNLEKATPEE